MKQISDYPVNPLKGRLHETAKIGQIFAVRTNFARLSVQFLQASDCRTSNCTKSDGEIGKFLSQNWLESLGKSDGQPGKIGLM
jgi:hypothetical protein